MKPAQSQPYHNTLIPTIMILLIGLTYTTQISANRLSQYIRYHRQQYRLQPLQQKLTQHKPKNGISVYIYNSILYTQICYEKNPNNIQLLQQMLPSMLIKHSYNPIQQKQKTPNTQTNPSQKTQPQPQPQPYSQSQVRCYQILDKMMLLQQPTVMSPVPGQNQQQDIGFGQVIQNQTNDTQPKKKQKKQISYLLSQYQLIHWIYKLGTQITKKLSVQQYNHKLSIDNITKFSIAIQLIHSKPTNIKQQLSIHILHAWIDTAAVQLYKNKNSIQKKLSGKGFHRTVTYTLKITDTDTDKMDINTQQCQISLLQTVPHTMYIDVDQLKGYGYGVQVSNDQQYGDGLSFINVQKPTYQSRQYQYRLQIGLQLWENIGVDQYQIRIPVHFRYGVPYHLHKPSTTTKTKTTGAYQPHATTNNNKNKDQDIVEYVQVDLYPTTSSKILCHSHRTGTGKGSTHTNQTQVYWLQEEYLGDRGTAYIPVGDGMIRSAVNIITLGSQVVCAVLLVKMLRK